MNEQDFDFNPNIKTKTRLVEEEPDELGRRKWKLEHYEEEEGPKEDLGILNQDPRTESFLVGRTEKLAINSKIGRGDALKKTMKQGGFFCDVCR
ncbi:MAG: hypothetical protein JST59_01525 [Actinobacteria bacterium]|nr:hypothetical protein [Actinomycetota bacterium]